jgi:hypothetical protein
MREGIVAVRKLETQIARVELRGTDLVVDSAPNLKPCPRRAPSS